MAAHPVIYRISRHRYDVATTFQMSVASDLQANPATLLLRSMNEMAAFNVYEHAPFIMGGLHF